MVCAPTPPSVTKPANWWLIVAAHLLLALMLWLLAGLRNLLPDLEARGDGLAVRHFGRWFVVPWRASGSGGG